MPHLVLNVTSLDPVCVFGDPRPNEEQEKQQEQQLWELQLLTGNSGFLHSNLLLKWYLWTCCSDVIMFQSGNADSQESEEPEQINEIQKSAETSDLISLLKFAGPMMLVQQIT